MTNAEREKEKRVLRMALTRLRENWLRDNPAADSLYGPPAEDVWYGLHDLEKETGETNVERLDYLAADIVESALMEGYRATPSATTPESA